MEFWQTSKLLMFQIENKKSSWCILYHCLLLWPHTLWYSFVLSLNYTDGFFCVVSFIISCPRTGVKTCYELWHLKMPYTRLRFWKHSLHISPPTLSLRRRKTFLCCPASSAMGSPPSVVSTRYGTSPISGTIIDFYIADNDKSLTNRLHCYGGCLVSR